MKKRLPIFFIAFVLSYFTSFLLDTPSSVGAASATHIVISEIQTAGTTTADEFIELYNPTSSAVSLSGWKLTRQTAGLNSSQYDVALLTGSIPAKGFYLIAQMAYDGSVGYDESYTGQNVANNNTVNLYQGDELIDRVGMGTSLNVETQAIGNPSDEERSIERKALTASTYESMRGSDVLSGNGIDTDNNANDFVRHMAPNFSDPQNSSSLAEEPPADTPTVEPTPTTEPTITETPTQTPTVIPTETPILTPTETQTPTPTDTETPTPTMIPTDTPTVTPSETPTPTVEPTETITPTLEPTVTVVPTATSTPTLTATPLPTVTPTITPVPTISSRIVGIFPYGSKQLVCRLHSRHFTMGFVRAYFPYISCAFL